jgi:hypothetical protein
MLKINLKKLKLIIFYVLLTNIMKFKKNLIE